MLSPGRTKLIVIIDLWLIGAPGGRTVLQEGDKDGSKDGEGDGAKSKKQREGFWRPDEHRALFTGNCDDQFRLGIKLTR